MKSKTLAAGMESLDPLQDFIFKCAEDRGMAMDRIQKVQLASEEALVNIFSYAYPPGETGEVTVTCSLENRTDFKIVLEDSGQPFDMLTREDPDTTLSLENRGIGGLGIFFVKQMMDRVDYCRREEKNILTLTISLT